MSLVRAPLYWISLLVITLYQGLRVIVAGLLGVRYRKGGVYDRAARGWGDGLARATGIRIRTEGLEGVPTDRPCVFISNHFSFSDIWVLLAVLPDSVRFVAKKELFQVPLFGHALRAARHIRIDRQNLVAAFGAYDEAGKAIREGISAIVFAEGTRSRNGKLQPFKKGPFVLAIAAQVPVVPVWVEGTYECLPPGAAHVEPGTAVLRFGAPIATDGLTYDDRERLMTGVREAIVKLAGDSPAVRVDPVVTRG